MRCEHCGADVSGAYCEYCGSKMPVERVETQTVNGHNVVINNYYYGNSQDDAHGGQQAGSRGNSPSGTSGGWQGAAQGGANGGWQTGPQRSASGPASYAASPYTHALPASPKSRLVALLLCFFLGYLGAHRFYAGRYLMGVVYIFTFGGLGCAWLADLILIICGKMKDRDGLPIVDWQVSPTA